MKMTTAPSVITHKDRRTGKTYAVQVSPELRNGPEVAFGLLVGQAERDYQATLPPEKRAKKESLDFECPRCRTKSIPKVRKQTVTHGFLFVYTDIIDIFICSDCGHEFQSNDINRMKADIVDKNWCALQFERFKDGEITDKVFRSLTGLN